MSIFKITHWKRYTVYVLYGNMLPNTRARRPPRRRRWERFLRGLRPLRDLRLAISCAFTKHVQPYRLLAFIPKCERKELINCYKIYLHELHTFSVK